MPLAQPPRTPPPPHSRKPAWIIGGLIFATIVGSCMGGGGTAPASAPAPSPTATTTTTTTRPSAYDVPAGAVQVTRVIDGDTFEVEGGRTIRVLGIDSCEAGTYGGEQATAQATSALGGHRVVLTAEPGVDRDRYDRELRYVQPVGQYGGVSGDFGKTMVTATHTGVYAGDNDAAAAYMGELRAADTGGRSCAAPAPSTDEGDTYVNVPDGDDDDGESRFCRGRAWC